MCKGEYITIVHASLIKSPSITKSSNNNNMLNFKKVQIKVHIIIFCVKHNRERTITLELETGKGRGVVVGHVYLSIVLISAIKYSCTI